MNYANDKRKQADKEKRLKERRKHELSRRTRNKRGIYGQFDWVTFGIFVLLLLISLFLMSTASSSAMEGRPHYYLFRHFFMMCVGMGGFIFVTLFDYRLYRDWARQAYIAVCVVLVITMIFGTGDGANRWIFGVQPSEFAKIAMIILFASFLDENRRQLKDGRFVLKSMVYMAIPTGLIFLEPDLGTSLVFIVIMLVMLYVAGANRRVFGLVVGFILGMVILIFVTLFFYTDGFNHVLEDNIPWLPLKSYQLMRLAIFINPEMDASNTGYHIIQSKIAVGSGGLFGKGYGHGTQVQGNFLPEHHTDFIFAVLSEEFGFFITAGVLAVYMILLLRLAKKAFYARDFYGTLIVTGISAMFLFQIFENIGMATGIMPVTGLPLPFFSYGGTSMITNMIAVGLVFSVSLRGKEVPSDKLLHFGRGKKDRPAKERKEKKTTRRESSRSKRRRAAM